MTTPAAGGGFARSADGREGKSFPHRRVTYLAVDPAPPAKAYATAIWINTVLTVCFGETREDAEAQADIHIERVQERRLKSEAAKHARRGGRTAQALHKRQRARAAPQEGDHREGER